MTKRPAPPLPEPSNWSMPSDDIDYFDVVIVATLCSVVVSSIFAIALLWLLG